MNTGQIVFVEAREYSHIFVDHHGIEQKKHQDGGQCQPTLLAADTEYGQQTFHFFKKYLTNTKLTGTQMANMGRGAHVFDTPSHRKNDRQAVCSR